MGNTVVVKDAIGANVTLDTQGTAITGQSLETGGYGPMGWFSSLRKALADNFTALQARFPTTLVGGRLSVDVGASALPTGAALDTTLTGGTAKSVMRGAAKGSTVAADSTVIPVDSNNNATNVTLAQPLDATNDEVRTVSCISANILNGATAADMTTTANTSVIAAPGSGVRIYVTDLLVTNGHATQGTRVDLLDGTTMIWTGFAGPGGGGFGKELRTPLKLTTNTALQAACGTAGAQVRVSASAYKAV